MNLQEALDVIGFRIIKDAKSNLIRKRKVATGSLYQSLGYKITGTGGDQSLTFQMSKYASFVDKGVNGTQTNYGSPFSYTMPIPSSNGEFIKSLIAWCKRKGMEKGAAYAIRNVIFRRGLKPTNFFTDAFDKNYDDLDKLLDQWVDDLNLFDE